MYGLKRACKIMERLEQNGFDFAIHPCQLKRRTGRALGIQTQISALLLSLHDSVLHFLTTSKGQPARSLEYIDMIWT